MPDTATAPTMTAAQLRAAGTRLLGFYLGGGGAKVDALVDTALLATRDPDGVFRLMGGGAKGGAQFDANYGAIGDSATAGRFTLNNGSGGLFVSGYDVDGNLAHNCEFISGSNWVARGAAAGRYTQASGSHAWYGDTGLTAGVAFAPTQRMLLAANGTLAIKGSSGVLFAVQNAGDALRGGSLTVTGSGGTGMVDLGSTSSGYGVKITIDGATAWNVTTGRHLLPGQDNALDFGSASFRGRTAYFTTGTINTCDVRFKTFRTDRQLREAEHAAALALFDAFGFCQFNDAIALKGADRARPHFVPGAQEVYSIWADHGLCDPLVENDKGELVPPPGAVPPAFICFDLIAEETAPVTEGWRPSALLGADGEPIMVKCAEGEEATEQRPTGETIVTREAGHIFGVRTDQLHSLMITALNTERKALAARIAALEPAA